ncbi:MAG: hypothetical protein HW413_534 [Thermoleophilia bacterium]|nr:hypothetical protein [Thermoleophilia bacterium]
MPEPFRSDRSLGGLVKTHDLIGTRRRRDRESGQAMVEFAIILFPLLILVAGIIQFGIGLNFWLDQQRIANQGARWAVVNAWPGCARTAAAGSCTGANALDAYLTQQALSQGLRNSVVVSICYPDDGDALTTIGRVGTPVRVSLQTPFTFVPIVGLGTITLRADATMRLEQTTDPTVPAPANGHLSGVGACP